MNGSNHIIKAFSASKVRVLRLQRSFDGGLRRREMPNVPSFSYEINVESPTSTAELQLGDHLLEYPR